MCLGTESLILSLLLFVVLVSFSHLGRTTVPVIVCHFPFLFCCSVRLFKTFPWVLMFFLFSKSWKLFIKSQQGCRTSTVASSWQMTHLYLLLPFPLLFNLPSTFPHQNSTKWESPWSPPMCWGQRCSRLKRISQIEFTLDETNRFACV